MAGIRFLLALVSILNVLAVKADIWWVYENPGEDGKIEMPEKWQIPEKYFPVIDLLIDELPCIHNHKIKVKYASLNTTMTARPTFSSLFKSRTNRTYVIRINNNQSFKGVRYHDIPDNARIGLWAHELMHIKDYSNRSFWGVMFRGWQYLSKSGKMRFEREIDRMVVDAGLGDYLYQWSYYVMEEADVCPGYKAFKQKIYLSPCQIIGNCDNAELEPLMDQY